MISLLNKSVCVKCAGISLGRYINSHGENDKCDYCGKENRHVMTIEQIMHRLYESWKLYYSNFDDSFFPDDLRTPYYLSDIVDDELVELYDAKESFLKDLKNIPDDNTWQKDSEYWTPYSEALSYSWRRFCDIVKTKWRYTYFLSGKDEFDPATYSPLETMKNIIELFQISESFITELPMKSLIFRTRKGEVSFPLNVKELGTAPAKYSIANRFNAQGIPMFYGSLDKDTCKKEACGIGKYIATGVFYNSKTIKLLNLTNIPEIPKLYDDDFRFIPALSFLHEFVKKICAPIKDIIDYIPTQVFTEYIRLQGERLFNLKGIKYSSAKNDDGENVVLFYSNDECIDESKYDGKSDCLILKGCYKN